MDKTARKVLAMAEPLIEELAAGEGYELVDVTYQREPQGWVLRVYIDKNGGVTISDCQGISRQLGDILEGKDVMRSAYNLEVSSPGINRLLKKPADFERFAGQRVRIKMRVAVEGRKNFLGKLTGCSDGQVHLDMDGESVQVPLEDISKAHIEFDFGSKK